MKTSKKPASSSKNNKLSSNINNFQKRWNVPWDEATLFDQFKNRLLFLIDKYLSIILTDRSNLNQYAYYCGLPAPYSMTGDDVFVQLDLQQRGLHSTIVFSTLEDSRTQTDIAWYLQNLFLVLNNIPQSKRTPQTELVLFAFSKELDDLLEASPSIQIRISNTKKGATIYPAGAKLLDDVLVNENLIWLQDYPESLTAFEQALTIYLNGDKPKFRNLKDNLRVAVEQLLRNVLSNKKSLENQSKELDAWLEKQGIHKQIRNIYGQLLFGNFAILQNEVAKHGDIDLTIEEVEYLIYLTGTFMRLIIQLHRSEA